jgi:ABC-2 type transport system ATP-binding protein
VTIFITTHYMDEAEHCRRVGFMSSGHLLAFDTPRALKERYLHGTTWELDVNPLLEAVEYLSAQPGVAQARLQGDRVMVIVEAGLWSSEMLCTRLVEQNITVNRIDKVEPSLEDVFTLLAHSR